MNYKKPQEQAIKTIQNAKKRNEKPFKHGFGYYIDDKSGYAYIVHKLAVVYKIPVDEITDEFLRMVADIDQSKPIMETFEKGIENAVLFIDTLRQFYHPIGNTTLNVYENRESNTFVYVNKTYINYFPKSKKIRYYATDDIHPVYVLEEDIPIGMIFPVNVRKLMDSKQNKSMIYSI